MKNKKTIDSTNITKELKITLLKLLKKGVVSKEDKEELIKLLELPAVQIEIIDKREQVRHELLN